VTAIGRGVAAAAMALTLLLAACGDGDRALVGYTRDPEPFVDVAPLPDVSRDGAPFAMRATEGDLLAVYFGFTNCPDVCPTTLADFRTARNQLGEDATRVGLAMVTVDPDRDTTVLSDYAQGFVDGAHALATDDAATLRQVADAFGVSYVVTNDDRGEPQVMHSPELFLVDDTGAMVLTWTFGTAPDDLAADMRQLLAG
jgi:protein SCO1